MLTRLKKQWTQIKQAPAGHRFRRRYEARHQAGRQRSTPGRVVLIVVAAVLIAIGIVLVFIPGPAVLFFFLAGALLAEESQGIARALDVTEVWLRRRGQRLRQRWRGRRWPRHRAPPSRPLPAPAPWLTPATPPPSTLTPIMSDSALTNDIPILYIKPGCPWCDQAVEILDENGISYHLRNVTENSEHFAEMRRKSKQDKAPVLDWHGHVLADFGADELYPFLRAQNVQMEDS